MYDRALRYMYMTEWCGGTTSVVGLQKLLSTLVSLPPSLPPSLSASGDPWRLQGDWDGDGVRPQVRRVEHRLCCDPDDHGEATLDHRQALQQQIPAHSHGIYVYMIDTHVYTCIHVHVHVGPHLSVNPLLEHTPTCTCTLCIIHVHLAKPMLNNYANHVLACMVYMYY